MRTIRSSKWEGGAYMESSAYSRHDTSYSACMSPENTHKLMGFYMEVFNTGRYTLVHGFCFFKLFPIGCIGYKCGSGKWLWMVLLRPFCRDTASRCGVFCSLMNTIERCKFEGIVDVFQAVKALRIQKPGSVLTQVYQFPGVPACYTLHRFTEYIGKHHLSVASIVMSAVDNAAPDEWCFPVLGK